MEVCPVPRIAGALTFKPTPYVDERGFFCRTFDVEVMRGAGIDPAAFTQDSLSRSARSVVRGLHLRRGPGEAKLVRCSFGAIFDVIVDLRPASSTYQNWESFELRDEEQVSLYIPAGCAHGFQALTGPADVSYRIDRPHDPSEDVTIAFDDPELAIPWPLPVTAMSERDRLAPSLAAVCESLTSATLSLAAAAQCRQLIRHRQELRRDTAPRPARPAGFASDLRRITDRAGYRPAAARTIAVNAAVCCPPSRLWRWAGLRT